MACQGTPPPLCARTLVFSTSAPGLVLAPGGGAVDVNVPGLAYFNVIEAPPGACPALRAGTETADLDVSVDVECTGPNDGTSAFTTTNVGTRFTEVSLPISLDAGPPRLCDLTSTATATMLDGTTLTATSSNNLCVVETLAGDPNTPRLDLELLDASNIKRVHPGDQTSVTYRITNNDPTETFSGKLAVSHVNSSRQPVQNPDPLEPLDDGPYAVSSPVEGDNFPIGFTEDLVNGCLYVPSDHDNPSPSTLSKQIDLDPGESIEVDIYARPFGGCSDGSCGVTTLVLDGQFTDASDGLACEGFIAAADTSVAPQYAWADSGAALAGASAPAPFVLEFIAQPREGETVPLAFVKSIPTLEFNGQMFPGSLFPEAFPYEGERGRITAQVGGPGANLTPGASTFTYQNEIEISPGAPLLFDFTQFNLGAPTGFENRAPGAVIEVGFRDFGQTENDFFVDLLYQFSGEAHYAGGTKAPLLIEGIEIGPGSNPNSFSVVASGVIPEGDGTNVEVFKVANDLRGFARAASDYDLDTINDDQDNCILETNADQRDTDGDGFGNACDPDLNQDGVVNTIDLGQLKAAFFTEPGDANWNEDADFNGDDSVNFLDLGRMKALFFSAPGPSATNP